MKLSRKNRAKPRSSKRYDLSKSALYRLERPKDLAKLFGLTEERFRELISNRENFYSLREEEIGGKIRALQVPTGAMRRCHGRVLGVVRNIRLPDHIRSPRRGSTAWGNAAIHLKANAVSGFDIRKFYPSTTEEHLFRLFHYRFEMSPDCSRLLAVLCSFSGSLPTGSPASPHLACLAHLDLFEEAAEVCAITGNNLSVWVDDVVISGRAHRRDIVRMIERRARAKGLETHKHKRGGSRQGIELTGAFVRQGKLTVANSSHLKVRDTTAQLKACTDPHDRYAILNRLASMARYQRTIARSGGGDISRLAARLSFYKREMQKLAAVLSVTEPTRPIECTQPWDGSDPF